MSSSLSSPPPTPHMFTYTSTTSTGGPKTQKLFRVPPLDQTQLISTPDATGIADLVALSVVPANAALCNTIAVTLPPTTFDFREEFSDFLSPIINQGTCGSCWAIASTQALSSRFAIIRNQKVKPLSAAYMLYCTRDTFSTGKDVSYGCTGGSLVDAYWFFNLNGIVSAACLKYDSLGDWDPTSESNTDLRTGTVRTQNAADMTETKTHVSCPMLECPTKEGGDDASEEQPWLFKTAISYIVAGTPSQSGGSEANIRQEIWKNGPVSSGFQVTQDFFTYWKGLLEKTLVGAAQIYVPGKPDDLNNPVMGNHAIQIVGWGDMQGTRFWIIANSWGATTQALHDYGNNGYFMMVRGTNAAAIESNVVGGMPKVHPKVVSALGTPAFLKDREMCSIIRYEINIETLKALDAGKFISLPDVRSEYEFTLPPRSDLQIPHINEFNVCPTDRPAKCWYSGACVVEPNECGITRATGGSVATRSIINSELASSRELQGKYLQHHNARHDIEVPSITRRSRNSKGRSVDGASLLTPITCFPPASLYYTSSTYASPSITSIIVYAVLLCVLLVLVGVMVILIINNKKKTTASTIIIS